MLNSYTFIDPRTGEVAGSNGWSYLWAALFGALYILFAGAPSRFFHALAWQLACIAGFFFVVFAATYIPQNLQAAFLVVAFPSILAIQSLCIVRMLRRAYRSRGWKVRKAD